MITDTDRINFLEYLRERTVFVNKKNPAHLQSTDVHIHNGCSLYARTGIGHYISFEGHGEKVRDAIDEAMKMCEERQPAISKD